jgi:MFS family permease
MTSTSAAPATRRRDVLVIAASSLGTVFEWYDFYLYGLLAAIIAEQFFAGASPSSAFIFALIAFAAGFAVRPFGALVFGRLGDLVGRKHTFLITMGLMGLSTFLVGLLPTYASIGMAAPLLLLALRLVQGLALGGEYGGAATYVAEHAPDNRRGLYTSFIQTTATLGLFAALLVVIVTRTTLGPEEFAAWGWRIPFLLSAILLAISMWIRMQLAESPAFVRMKEEGTRSTAPIREAFGRWSNLKIVLIALFGAVAGQAVVWYAGQFYALFFLERVLKVEAASANIMVAIALALATPFFIVFGALSDRIGRKPIILAGLLLAAVTYVPLFKALTVAANPALAEAQERSPVIVHADPATCAFQFDPIGRTKFTESGCDIAKAYLARAGISYQNVPAPPDSVTTVQVGKTRVQGLDWPDVGTEKLQFTVPKFEKDMRTALDAAGYPAKADPAGIDRTTTIAILFALVIYVTMVYGPIAALLVELFPTRIRYTAMSLPYHIGNGWFGGFLPATAFAIVAARGGIYDGLIYPIAVAGIGFVIGLLFLPETRGRSLD